MSRLPFLFGAGVLLAAAAFAQESILPPGAALLPESALPDYERALDHAGLIRGWNRASLARDQRHNPPRAGRQMTWRRNLENVLRP